LISNFLRESGDPGLMISAVGGLAATPVKTCTDLMDSSGVLDALALAGRVTGVREVSDEMIPSY
jgi:hypothetical protein